MARVADQGLEGQLGGLLGLPNRIGVEFFLEKSEDRFSESHFWISTTTDSPISTGFLARRALHLMRTNDPRHTPPRDAASY